MQVHFLGFIEKRGDELREYMIFTNEVHSFEQSVSKMFLEFEVSITFILSIMLSSLSFVDSDTILFAISSFKFG